MAENERIKIRGREGDAIIVHGTAVAWEGRGLLLIGASGSGKSALALELMAYGAQLVADDMVALESQADQLFARAPLGLTAAIEARGMGLLPAKLEPRARLKAVFDAECRTAARLPQLQEICIQMVTIPLLHRPESGAVAPALLQYLKWAE